MDLVVKRVIIGEGSPVYGICKVVERQGKQVTGWQLLYLKTGEPWVFGSAYWANKKKRAFETESADYLRQAGIAVPEEGNVQKPPLTIDLVAPEGNVFALVGKACQALEQAGQAEQAKELREWLRTVPPLGGVSYDDVRHTVEQYCDVTWLNETTSSEAGLG